jgi:hypothetical protein
MATLMAQFNKNNHLYLENNKSLFEVVMLADQYGNNVGPANPSGMAVDAFGRARVSTPLTLFDSSHRYRDNGLWDTAVVSGGTTSFSANEGLVNLVVDTTANSEVIRETSTVFSYQPGKSLQIFSTFVMNTAKEGLRQRVGYFSAQNGIYLELDGNDLYLVKRSYNSGIAIDTRIHKNDWNMDSLDGAGPSGLTLDISKAHILFIDVEWLGVGTVRCGFVINGEFVHVHSFHHANSITSTYMTTASLPLRYEIKNNSATSSSSTLKQICSTVISEGGYELRGTQQAVGTAITAPKSLTTAGTYYPVVSIRLKATALDAVVIPTAVSVMGVATGIYSWRILEDATVTVGSWTDAGANSAVEYTLAGTAVSGGRVLASGYLTSNAQGAATIDILKDALFKFQLKRNGLTGAPRSITLAVSASTNTEVVHGSMDWEEISR